MDFGKYRPPYYQRLLKLFSEDHKLLLKVIDMLDKDQIKNLEKLIDEKHTKKKWTFS